MPPSGFSLPAVAGLSTFFSTTLSDLKQEVAEGKHSSLQTALTFEISQISQALESQELLLYEREVLVVTQKFYTSVLESGEESALSQIVSITTLHVGDDGKVTRQ